MATQYANNIRVVPGSFVPPLKEQLVSPLPPRYRLRDLILGDYAFGDDGERYVLALDLCFVTGMTHTRHDLYEFITSSTII